ncbi:hypothetical protein [Mycobacterium tuberculosis]|uniref:hypothetical protein n=1 Tax=Mycobacterium tuberculosis TaxID=1773 RepID=UPI002712103C|nr:hypothetical protein [Mycobacterium tuberculosis]
MAVPNGWAAGHGGINGDGGTGRHRVARAVLAATAGPLATGESTAMAVPGGIGWPGRCWRQRLGR